MCECKALLGGWCLAPGCVKMDIQRGMVLPLGNQDGRVGQAAWVREQSWSLIVLADDTGALANRFQASTRRARAPRVD